MMNFYAIKTNSILGIEIDIKKIFNQNKNNINNNKFLNLSKIVTGNDNLILTLQRCTEIKKRFYHFN